jgi:tetratricopeptide (TPR) repeat protein
VRVSRVLLDRAAAVLIMGRLEQALAYVQIAERLFDPSAVSPEILNTLANVHRQIAENRLAPGTPPEQVAPEARFETREHHRAAAEYAIRHARAVVGDPAFADAWADSLFLAADSYDLGGEVTFAIRHFEEYVSQRPQDDPRRAEAMFRLGRAYQADLQPAMAVERFDDLRKHHGTSAWATRSLVPLARCYLALDRRQEAVHMLQEVLAGGSALDPAAQDYCDAVIELGRILHEAEDHRRAIERLTEALERYPDDPRLAEVRFRLGDSYRRLALEIDQELEGTATLTPARSRELQGRREAYLQQAASLYAAVKRDLEAADPLRLQRLEEDILRYSFLYVADCVFHLGDYERAIGLYEQVVGRYRSHVASMTALIQIVNCHTRLGDMERAGAAHRRALTHLASLPEKAFDTPDALMDRSAWERWLRSSPLGPIAMGPQSP